MINASVTMELTVFSVYAPDVHNGVLALHKDYEFFSTPLLAVPTWGQATRVYLNHACP